MLSHCSLGCSPTVPIVCSPLDAGQIDIVMNRHDRPIADFRDKWCPYMINFKDNIHACYFMLFNTCKYDPTHYYLITQCGLGSVVE